LYKSNGQTAYIRLPFIAALFIDPGQIKAPQPEGHTQRERRCNLYYFPIRRHIRWANKKYYNYIYLTAVTTARWMVRSALGPAQLERS